MKNKYFSTTNFYQAAFLVAKGMELADIDFTEPRRCKFVFFDTPEREKLLEFFNFGREGAPEILIDARKFITAIKSLKEKIYSPN